MAYDWQEAFKLKEGLTQLDMENFERVLFSFPKRVLAGNTGAALRLKCAIEGGWIASPPVEVGDFKGEKRWFYDGKNVEEMHPGAVAWFGEQIDAAYTEATQIPKNL
jgi:hypothetical protein